MLIDLNYLLEKKPDFFEITQTEQIKYLAFVHTKNINASSFDHNNVKQIYDSFNLSIPTNFAREFKKLLIGKLPVLVKKSGGYVFHPRAEKILTLEIFSTSSSISKNDPKTQRNTELFSRYDLHPKIKRVSFRQFQDGFYKEAIQNAFVEVIDNVKLKANNPTRTSNGRTYELDGDDLMNRVFGCDDQNPIIKFNDLSSGLERAEQRGFMNLFKGIVGIRDKKAHLNFIQQDPLKTIEYLSLASLLMRLMDESN